MKSPGRLTRRGFLAASSGAVGAGSLHGQEAKDGTAPGSRLAIHGGKKAVRDRRRAGSAGASRNAND